MILPNVRSSFGRDDVAQLIGLLSRGDPRERDRVEARVRDEGLDAVLDDPRTLGAVLKAEGIARIPSRLVFYLLVRHSLLEAGVESTAAADYLAAMLLEFGRERRAFRPTEEGKETYEYLVDLVEALTSATGREAFLLRAHLGNFALWMSGLFPDHITARVHRRGAPGLRYYEEMGATGYRLAADCRDAEDWGLDGLYHSFAENFPVLRIALNRIADRHLFSVSGDPVDRLLRQVADRFRIETERGRA